MKKSLVLAVVATLVLSLAGCGEAKKYEKDIELVLELVELDIEDDPEDAKDELDEMEFATKEGQKIKKVVDDYCELMMEAQELEEEYKNEDIRYNVYEGEMEYYEYEMEELAEKSRKRIEKLYDAAEDAGADEDLLEELEDEFDL